MPTSADTVTDLPGVLKRLAELEPERFYLSAHEGEPTIDLYHDNEELTYFLATLPGCGSAALWVEGAVREAIEARGWSWECIGMPGRAGASIYRPYDPTRPDTDMLMGECLQPGIDSPALALALAYLRALEAQGGPA